MVEVEEVVAVVGQEVEVGEVVVVVVVEEEESQNCRRRVTV